MCFYVLLKHICKLVLTQRAVALHAAVGGAALHGADHAAAHQDHAHVTSVRLLDVLLEEVGCVVTDQVAQICQVVLVPRQEHSLAWRRVRRRPCLLLLLSFWFTTCVSSHC